MRHWKETLIRPSVSIRAAIERIDASAMQIALVTDENNRLLGTVTDGDIRRAILQGIALNEPVEQVMNPSPTVAQVQDTMGTILSIMRSKRLRHLPVVDHRGCVLDVKVLDDLVQAADKENWVVLMVGGLGTRLRPLTDGCPKPLLKVGDRPLLEIIVERLRMYGFRKFYLSVNYKAEMIKEHFKDGSNWGVEIRYLHEPEKMGTAGPLSLLPEKPTQPLIVMNGDLLTKVNFEQLLAFHCEYQADATMCVREYEFQIPFGVVKTKMHRLVDIQEKPLERHFVNAGIYVLEPDVLQMIPSNTYFDMPDLFKVLVERDDDTAVFPVREYWLDIGHLEDFKKAKEEIAVVFDDD